MGLICFLSLVSCSGAKRPEMIARNDRASADVVVNNGDAEPVDPVPLPVPVSLPTPIPAPTPMPSPLPIPSPAMPVDGPVKGVCKETLDYDPTAFKCAFKESSSNSVWKNEASWNVYVSSLVNKDASWIGPLPAKKKGAHNNLDYCPSVGEVFKLIHVSHFKLDVAGKVLVQAVMDDNGIVQIWKNADSKKIVYTSAKNSFANESVALDSGFYSLVVTTFDNGKSATSFIGSIHKAENKQLLRQTELSKEWCIFKVNKDVVVEDFLSANAACQPCMVGDGK